MGGKTLDPDTALRDARNALERMRDWDSAQPHEDAANDLAEAFSALDRYLVTGGILPLAWVNARPAK